MNISEAKLTKLDARITDFEDYLPFENRIYMKACVGVLEALPEDDATVEEKNFAYDKTTFMTCDDADLNTAIDMVGSR